MVRQIVLNSMLYLFQLNIFRRTRVTIRRYKLTFEFINLVGIIMLNVNYNKRTHISNKYIL